VVGLLGSGDGCGLGSGYFGFRVGQLRTELVLGLRFTVRLR